jgi:hypothetical protein
LFNFASWENITFSMAGLSNFTVFLFILLSLHYLTSSTSNNIATLFLSLFFLALAMFTQGRCTKCHSCFNIYIDL